jgi:hypothetical protein
MLGRRAVRIWAVSRSTDPHSGTETPSLDVLVHNAAIPMLGGTVFQQPMAWVCTTTAGPRATVEAFKSLLLKSRITAHIAHVASRDGSVSLMFDAKHTPIWLHNYDLPR